MRNLAVIATIITALVLTSCAGSGTVQNPPAASPASAMDARALYKDNCALCHGANRQGTPNIGPPLAPDSLARLSDAQVRDVIVEGRANTAMAGFNGRLSPEQIAALLQLLRQ